MAGSGNANLGGCAVAGILILAVIGSCLPSKDKVASQSSAKWVVAESLNCRAQDSMGADVVTSFRRDDSVTIAEERGGWARIEGVNNCWVASRYLASAPSGSVNSAAAATLLASPGLGSNDSQLGPASDGATTGRAGDSGSNTLGASERGSDDASRGRAYASGKSTISKGKKAFARKKTSGWKKKSGPKRGKKRSGNFSSGACPCSGYNICIGPRGGRYCITSGGNKRYGV